MDINVIFRGWHSACAEVADLARVPADRRGKFFKRITAWCDAATEVTRLERHSRWDAMSDSDRRAITDVKRKVLAAHSAAQLLTQEQYEHVAREAPNFNDLYAQTMCIEAGSIDWTEALEKLADTLAAATATPRTVARGRGRPPGPAKTTRNIHTLLRIIEDSGGKLPSVDHDPERVTINKIIKILQPHFLRGDLRPISASTFRRVRKAKKAERQ